MNMYVWVCVSALGAAYRLRHVSDPFIQCCVLVVVYVVEISYNM